jgi:hypothetical protein
VQIKVNQIKSEFFIDVDNRAAADKELSQYFEQDFDLVDHLCSLGFAVDTDYLGNINDLLVDTDKLDLEETMEGFGYISPYVKPGSKLEFFTMDGDGFEAWSWFFIDRDVFQLRGDIKFDYWEKVPLGDDNAEL